MTSLLISSKTFMPIILFDVDGTLTPSSHKIEGKMIEIIEKLSELNNTHLGLVGGGTYDKIKWQMGETIKFFKYIFSECGAIIHVDGKLVSEKNMLDYCDREVLNNMIKKSLSCIATMPIIYHGNNIDFRKGLIYVSPPGIQATAYERNIFMDADKKYNLRDKLMNELKSLNKDDSFEIALGGAVGVSIYPRGWNKSQVIDYFIENSIIDKFYYFGDKTEPDGNDYPIYTHKLVEGISVVNYEDTIKKIIDMFLI